MSTKKQVTSYQFTNLIYSNLKKYSKLQTQLIVISPISSEHLYLRVRVDNCFYSYQHQIRVILTHFTPMSFLYPLKTSENHRFSDVFKGYRNVTLDQNWLNLQLIIKVNEPRYKQCEVTPHFSTGKISLKIFFRKGKYWYNQFRKAFW